MAEKMLTVIARALTAGRYATHGTYVTHVTYGSHKSHKSHMSHKSQRRLNSASMKLVGPTLRSRVRGPAARLPAAFRATETQRCRDACLRPARTASLDPVHKRESPSRIACGRSDCRELCRWPSECARSPASRKSFSIVCRLRQSG